MLFWYRQNSVQAHSGNASITAIGETKSNPLIERTTEPLPVKHESAQRHTVSFKIIGIDSRYSTTVTTVIKHVFKTVKIGSSCDRSNLQRRNRHVDVD